MMYYVRWTAMFVVLVVTACGRLGFDPQTASDATGGDASGSDGPVVCPPTMALISGTSEADFCIDKAEAGFAKRADAATMCAASGSGMCTKARLEAACPVAADHGLIDMVDDWEWSKDYGSLISVYAVNNGMCGTETFFNESNSQAFRCCA